MKKIIAIVLMAAVMLCCTACGLDMSKVKGDWTVESYGGKTVEQYVEETGLPAAYHTMNATVTDDTFTTINPNTSISYKIRVKSNGFECLDDSKNVVLAVEYVADKDRLKFSTKDGAGNIVEYILKRGTADLTIPAETGAADNAGEGAADNAGTADNAGAATAEAGYYTAEGYYTGEAE